jgi:hypothetical protein
MASETQVSLKVLSVSTGSTTAAYGLATNGSGPVYITGTNGIYSANTPTSNRIYPAGDVANPIPMYGIVSIPGVGQNYTYSFSGNTIFQFAPNGTSLATPTSIDVTTLASFTQLTINSVNYNSIYTSPSTSITAGSTSTSNNIFCVPIVVNNSNILVVTSTSVPYTVQSVFGTTANVPNTNQGTFLIPSPNPVIPYETSTEFTTDGRDIYALLQDSRILKITFPSQPATLTTATLNLLSAGPINTQVNMSGGTSAPTLATGLTYIGTGIAAINGNTGYLYAFDGYNGGINSYKILTISPLSVMTLDAASPSTAVSITSNGLGQFSGLPDVQYANAGNILAGYTYSGINYLLVGENAGPGSTYYTIDVLQLGAYNALSKIYNNVFSFQEFPLAMFTYNNTLYVLSYATYNSIHPMSNSYTVYQLGITIYTAPICFLKGTYIYTNKGYELIETLKKGDLVNTFKDNYVPIDTIVEEEMYHDAQKERNKGQLYKLDYPEYPQLLKELYITGAHSVLVGKLTDKQKNQIIQDYGKTFATDLFDRLPAYIDEKAKVHDVSGKYTIYHLALENENNFSNYGIYANGLLVESLSKNDCVNRLF